jgi:Ca-activated chloride channel family protein
MFRRQIRLAVLVVATGSGLAGIADGAGLLVADGGFGGVLDIKEHDVRVVINNGVAVTEVEQIFLNTENRIVEALYTFPVPKGASVANFSMWINGKEMIGEVVEKQRARQIYESYKQTRRDPGLLEQVDYKTFEMRIFPIGPGAEQRIKVTYYQQLDFDHDWGSYVYPLATVTRRDIDQRTTGKFALTMDVKSEVPIVKIESPSHPDDFVTVNHSPNYVQASLETDGGDLSRDLVLAFKTVRPRTGIDMITSKQPREDGFFMLTLTAGEELAELNRGMDYVFIIDVSGSMANDGKLRLSRNSVFAFMDSLSAEDRFEVITFNVSANTLFNELQQITDDGKQAARAFLESQRARGGTALRPAISSAYRYQDSDRTLNVVILSDGMTEQREQRELLQLIRERPSGSRVFCVGVGNEVNRPLLQQLANDAGGLAAFISQDDDFQRQAQSFRRKLMRPAIRDLRLQISGAGTYDIEPEQLPDLFHGSPLRMFGRYKSGGDVAVTISGEVQGSAIEQTVNVTLPAANPDNPEIERMWAWHRVQRLMADERGTGVAGRHEDEIVRLCEGYSIVSPYASFIVLENDAEYQRWKIERRNAVRIERDRVAQRRVRAELDRLRQQALAKLGPDRAREPASAQPDSDDLAAATPPADSRPGSNTVPTRNSPTSRDISLPGGGGAIDPITGLIALGLGGAVAAAARRRRRK